MPLFKCSKCGCVENTATSNYWLRKDDEIPLCSECDPKIGRWHKRFPKIDADANGYKKSRHGFIGTTKKPGSAAMVKKDLFLETPFTKVKFKVTISLLDSEDKEKLDLAYTFLKLTLENFLQKE